MKTENKQENRNKDDKKNPQATDTGISFDFLEDAIISGPTCLIINTPKNKNK